MSGSALGPRDTVKHTHMMLTLTNRECIQIINIIIDVLIVINVLRGTKTETEIEKHGQRVRGSYFPKNIGGAGDIKAET